MLIIKMTIKFIISHSLKLPAFTRFQKVNFLSTMTKKALIIGSDGSEDIELIVTSDILRRAGFLNIKFN